MGYMNYEERLEVAKRLYELSNAEQKTALECIFPELCESEDEKIRKFLIKWIQDNYYHGTTEIPTKTLIAWLKKQGEQKLPIEKLPEEMKTIGESLGFTTQKECDEYNKMVSDLIMSDGNKEEQKEAKKNEQSPKWKGIKDLETAILAAHPTFEQKPAWTEEDEVLLSSIINTLEMIEGSGASKMKIE